MAGKGVAVGAAIAALATTVAVSAGPAHASAGCSTVCAKGSWHVLKSQLPVRASRAVLLRNGDVLLVTGSEMSAGRPRESAVYNPAQGTYKVIKTPVDFSRAGMVQLPDGKVLIIGGTKAYPGVAGARGYEGLATSYLFDPTTDRYQKIGTTRPVPPTAAGCRPPSSARPAETGAGSRP